MTFCFLVQFKVTLSIVLYEGIIGIISINGDEDVKMCLKLRVSSDGSL